MMRLRRVQNLLRFGPVAMLLLMLIGTSIARRGWAQEPSRAFPEDAKRSEPDSSLAKVERTGNHRYRLGEIEFDSRVRELKLPVTVNKREGGPMEYLLVHERGKVHESILTTTASPLQLQIALKLLHYHDESGDLFERIGLPRLTRSLKSDSSDSEVVLLGDVIAFFFQPDGGIEIPACELVLDEKTGRAMTPDAWMYTGSAAVDGQFLAESSGSIIAIYLDPAAQFNMTRDGAEFDDRWGANSDVIPVAGTKGTLIMRPYSAPSKKSEEASSTRSP